MRSSDHSDELDLERDLPTTQADIEVLRRLRNQQQVSFVDALAMMSDLHPFSVESSNRPLPTDWEPFRL